MNKINDNKPLFSVILPTKGRPKLTRLVVDSVLSQDFSDYELIVVDNDDAQETFQSLNGLFDHPKFRYIRTGELSMLDNWNAAFEYFNGKYLLWMDSKSFFYPHAFQELSRFINDQKKPEAVSWKYDFAHDSGSETKFVRIMPHKISERLSSDVLEEFINYRLDRHIWAQTPRGVCTAISQDVLTKIKTIYDPKIFTQVSPDLTLLLKVLEVTKKIHYFPTPLTCVTSTKVGHGRQSNSRTLDPTYFLGTGKYSREEEEMIVPLNNRFLAACWIANDIEVVLNRKVPVWSSHRKPYCNAIAREVATTMARFGNVFGRKELVDIIKFWGLDIKPYIIFIKRYLRCSLVTHFDKLPSKLRQWLLTLTILKHQENDVETVVEIDMDSFELSKGLIVNGRNWRNNR